MGRPHLYPRKDSVAPCDMRRGLSGFDNQGDFPDDKMQRFFQDRCALDRFSLVSWGTILYLNAQQGDIARPQKLHVKSPLHTAFTTDLYMGQITFDTSQ